MAKNDITTYDSDTLDRRSGWRAAFRYHEGKNRRSEMTHNELDAWLDCQECPFAKGTREHLLWKRGWELQEGGMTLDALTAYSCQIHQKKSVKA